MARCRGFGLTSPVLARKSYLTAAIAMMARRYASASVASMLRCLEISGLAFSGLRAPVEIFDKRRNRLSELRKAYVPALPIEEWPAELPFERLDCFCQRRLGDPTTLRGASKMQFVA